MKIGDVTQAYLADYLKLGTVEDMDKEELAFLKTCEIAAKRYILSYTGIPEDKLDEYEDLTIAYIVLIADMHDQRSRYVDKGNPNMTVETILGFYQYNLL